MTALKGPATATETTSYKQETVQLTGPDSEPLTTITYIQIPAKIELKVTPHISKGELLRLEVTMSRSDFGERPDPAAPPNTTSNDILTTVFVPDDKTIILGGLVKAANPS